MISEIVISYLFLGGAGSGALFMLIVCRRIFPNQAAALPVFFRTGFQTATGALALGALCLFFDLGRPDRVLFLYTHPTLSYLTFGTYALSVATACALVLAISASLPATRLPLWLSYGIETAGALSAVAMMLYTGMLFYSFGSELLIGNWLLPVLFLFSSLSTGIALVISAGWFVGANVSSAGLTAWLLRLDACFILAEAILLTALVLAGLRNETAMLSVQALVSGDFALAFWVGLVACGLVFPLLWYVLSIPGTSVLPATIMVLVGGFFLRYCLIGAGIPILFPGAFSTPQFIGG